MGKQPKLKFMKFSTKAFSKHQRQIEIKCFVDHSCRGEKLVLECQTFMSQTIQAQFRCILHDAIQKHRKKKFSFFVFSIFSDGRTVFVDLKPGRFVRDKRAKTESALSAYPFAPKVEYGIGKSKTRSAPCINAARARL